MFFMFFYKSLKNMFLCFFYFLMFFVSFSLHCFLLFCFENIHTQHYKYDAIHFGKLR